MARTREEGPEVYRKRSDMSDAEWAVTEPALPVPAWKQGRAAPGGALPPRPRRRHGGYAGWLVTWANKALKLTVQIVFGTRISFSRAAWSNALQNPCTKTMYRAAVYTRF